MVEENKESMTKQPQKFTMEKVKLNDSPPSFLFVLFQRYFYYFIFLEIIIIVALGYWFLLKPRINIIFADDTRTALEDQKAQEKVIKYNQQIKELKGIVLGYSRISEIDINKINQILPDKPDERDLFAQIEKIVKANGILLESIFIDDSDLQAVQPKTRSTRSALEVEATAEAEVISSNMKELKIIFTVSEVSYPAFKSLLNSLESNLRIIDVESIEYDPKDASAIFSVKSYYWPQLSTANSAL